MPKSFLGMGDHEDLAGVAEGEVIAEFLKNDFQDPEFNPRS